MDSKKTRDLTIADRMSRTPHSIGSEQPISAAHDLMRSNGIRHLPVFHAEKLVGIVSLRDLHFVETFRDVDPEKVRVEDAMTRTVYAVEPTTPLKEVVSEMAKRKMGSALVVEGSKVVGVFTTIDALDTLLGLLDGQEGV